MLRHSRQILAGTLVVCSLMVQLASAAEPNPDKDKPAGQDIAAAVNPENASETKIRKALDEMTELKFVETPLKDVVAFLRTKHGIEIQIDQKAINDVGIGTDTPVTRQLKGVSLESALRLVLRELDLTTTIDNEVLLITTPEEVERRLTTRVYPVRDLVTLPGDEDALADFDTLSELITTTIEPHSWDDVGGPGSISKHGPTMIVSQTQDNHRKLQQLLAMLRSAPPLGDPQAAKTTEPVCLSVTDPASAKLLKALDEPTQCEFKETTLRDIVEYFRKLHGIEIQIDQKALDDVGIGTETPVTRNLKDVSLRSALRLILRDLDLTFTIQDEVLLVTTPEVNESLLHTVVYPVFDLLDLPADAEPFDVREAMEQIADVLTSASSPESWEEVGGPGSIAPFVNRAALVCSQTGEVHDELARLLANLRAVRAKQRAAAGAKGPEFQTAVFHLNPTKNAGEGEKLPQREETAKPEELEEVITTLVSPESWQAKQVYLKVLPGKVVVRQRKRVLRNVEQFLIRLGMNPRRSDFDKQIIPPMSGAGFFSAGDVDVAR